MIRSLGYLFTPEQGRGWLPGRAAQVFVPPEDAMSDTDKAETSLPGTFEKWGEAPPERAKKHPKMFLLVRISGMA